MGSESIAHEAEGWGREEIQLDGQKYRDETTSAR